MNKKIVALALIACLAVASSAVVYVKIRQPTQGDETNGTEDLLDDLEDYLDFENYGYDFDLDPYTGDWGE